MSDWENRLEALDEDGFFGAAPKVDHGPWLKELLGKIQARRRPMAIGDERYTVVVQLPPEDALKNDDALMAFVLPTKEISLATVQDFRDAAAKGGCRVRVFTGLRNSGIEHVKWELMRYGSTTVDG